MPAINSVGTQWYVRAKYYSNEKGKSHNTFVISVLRAQAPTLPSFLLIFMLIILQKYTNET